MMGDLKLLADALKARGVPYYITIPSEDYRSEMRQLIEDRAQEDDLELDDHAENEALAEEAEEDLGLRYSHRSVPKGQQNAAYVLGLDTALGITSAFDVEGNFLGNRSAVERVEAWKWAESTAQSAVALLEAEALEEAKMIAYAGSQTQRYKELESAAVMMSYELWEISEELNADWGGMALDQARSRMVSCISRCRRLATRSRELAVESEHLAFRESVTEFHNIADLALREAERAASFRE